MHRVLNTMIFEMIKVKINGSTVRSNCLDFTPFVGRHVRLSDQAVYSLRSWIPVAL
jgi:hypothetical protein